MTPKKPKIPKIVKRALELGLPMYDVRTVSSNKFIPSKCPNTQAKARRVRQREAHCSKTQ